MATPLPFLRNTASGLQAQVLFPFTRIVSTMTQVAIFQGATEQRWVSRSPLFGFQLPFSSLNAADKAALLTVFTTELGRFGSDVSLTLGVGGTTYSDMTIGEDSLSALNRIPLFYDQQITLQQVRNYPWTVPTVGSSYPNLLFGGSSATKSSERPFVQVKSYFTDENSSPYGQQYTTAWFGGGLGSKFPSTYLKSWKLSYSLLTDADATTIENFFLGKQGRYTTFSFTDPIDGSSNANVRFDSDTLAFRYLTKNMQSTEVTLRQIWV